MGEKSVETVGTYEMLWDCEHCGTKRLLGKSQRHCAECGAPQNPDKRYFPPEGEEKKVDGHVYEGADRYCAHCNAPMAAKANNCTSCGAKMDGTAEVKPVVTAAPPAPSKPFPWLYVLVGVILFGGLIWWRCIRTKEAAMQITGHSWTRTIAVQVYGEVQKSAWKGDVPAGAQSVACQREERDKKQIEDGKDCHEIKVDNKDGTFDKKQECTPKYREEPVYDDKCTYTELDWKDDKPIVATGRGLDAAWPTKDVPAKEVARTVGNKRESARTATYVLEIGKQTCEVEEPVWRKYKDDQQVKVNVRAASGNVVCSDL